MSAERLREAADRLDEFAGFNGADPWTAPLAAWLRDTAEFFNPNSAIWGRALAVVDAILGGTS